MNNISELLDKCRSLGATLTPVQGTLRVRAPQPLPSDIIDELREAKPQIIAELSRQAKDEFDCWVLQPMLRTAGLFKHTGQITVYITADSRRIPVLMKTKVFIGSVSAELTSYEPGG